MRTSVKQTWCNQLYQKCNLGCNGLPKGVNEVCSIFGSWDSVLEKYRLPQGFMFEKNADIYAENICWYFHSLILILNFLFPDFAASLTQGSKVRTTQAFLSSANSVQKESEDWLWNKFLFKKNNYLQDIYVRFLTILHFLPLFINSW